MPELVQNCTRVLYIHGFNSSPSSPKAQAFANYCDLNGLKTSLSVPALPYDPVLALKTLEDIIKDKLNQVELLVGSSLGGYYATFLAEKFNLKAALVNPAMVPEESLKENFLGKQRNMYTGESYEITMADVEFLESLELKEIRHPENFLLMVQTADEVLDYRLAVKKYSNSRQIIQQGGDHSFVNFDSMFPEIFNFAGLPIH